MGFGEQPPLKEGDASERFARLNGVTKARLAAGFFYWEMEMG